ERHRDRDGPRVGSPDRPALEIRSLKLRVTLCGGHELASAADALGLIPADAATAALALIDLREPGSVAQAAALPAELPRVVVGDEAQIELAGALGMPKRPVARPVATEAAPALRVVGGPPSAPSASLARSALRAALELSEIAIVDAPTLADECTRQLLGAVDRVVVLSYDDPVSIAALAASDIPEGA